MPARVPEPCAPPSVPMLGATRLAVGDARSGIKRKRELQDEGTPAASVSAPTAAIRDGDSARLDGLFAAAATVDVQAAGLAEHMAGLGLDAGEHVGHRFARREHLVYAILDRAQLTRVPPASLQKIAQALVTALGGASLSAQAQAWLLARLLESAPTLTREVNAHLLAGLVKGLGGLGELRTPLLAAIPELPRAACEDLFHALGSGLDIRSDANRRSLLLELLLASAESMPNENVGEAVRGIMAALRPDADGATSKHAQEEVKAVAECLLAAGARLRPAQLSCAMMAVAEGADGVGDENARKRLLQRISAGTLSADTRYQALLGVAWALGGEHMSESIQRELTRTLVASGCGSCVMAFLDASGIQRKPLPDRQALVRTVLGEAARAEGGAQLRWLCEAIASGLKRRRRQEEAQVDSSTWFLDTVLRTRVLWATSKRDAVAGAAQGLWPARLKPAWERVDLAVTEMLPSDFSAAVAGIVRFARGTPLVKHRGGGFVRDDVEWFADKLVAAPETPVKSLTAGFDALHEELRESERSELVDYLAAMPLTDPCRRAAVAGIMRTACGSGDSVATDEMDLLVAMTKTGQAEARAYLAALFGCTDEDLLLERYFDRVHVQVQNTGEGAMSQRDYCNCMNWFRRHVLSTQAQLEHFRDRLDERRHRLGDVLWNKGRLALAPARDVLRPLAEAMDTE